jgi:hypothetical protein
VPDDILGYRFSPFAPGHDSRGYRNDDALAECDILAAGDSTTYGYGVRSEEAWPEQVATAASLSVYNAGIGGYGPCEYAVVIDELMHLHPDTVIVGVLLSNDLANTYKSVYIEGRFPEMRSGDESVLAAIAAEDGKLTLEAAFEAIDDTQPDVANPLRRFLAEQSSLYGAARTLYSRVTAERVSNSIPPGPWRDSFENASRRPFHVSWSTVSEFRTVFVPPQQRALATDLSDPRIREGMRITKVVLRNLKVTLDLSQANS